MLKTLIIIFISYKPKSQIPEIKLLDIITGVMSNNFLRSAAQVSLHTLKNLRLYL